MDEKKITFILGEGLDKLPERRYQKGSKYDVILEKAQTIKAIFVPVEVEGKDANYVRTQLYKRIKILKLKGIGVVVANGKCYISRF